MLNILGLSSRIGGGWTAASHISKALNDLTGSYQQSDTVLICGASMVKREDVEMAKRDGKKIVLRIDNALLPSNNRGGGMTHMKDYADLADLLIYQSKWARDYLAPYLGKRGPVILNATDLDTFSGQREYREKSEAVYGYIRSSRHETKMWEAARYYYSRIWQQNPNSKLLIIGKFSRENLDYNFNFFMGERYQFLGEQPYEVMPDWYRKIDVLIAPYFNDACSNTIIEALVSGCVLLDNPFLKTGGTPEITRTFQEHGPEYFGLHRLRQDYLKALEAL